MDKIYWIDDEVWNKGLFRLRSAIAEVMDSFKGYGQHELAKGAVEPLAQI